MTHKINSDEVAEASAGIIATLSDEQLDEGIAFLERQLRALRTVKQARRRAAAAALRHYKASGS